MPYFIDTDGYTLTETLAIQEYIAAKWCPELLGTTSQERATVAMLMNVVNDLKWAVTKPCYMPDTVLEELVDMMKEKAESIAKHLVKTGGFLLSVDKVTYPDFYLFELVLFMAWATQDQLYRWYPEFERFCAMMAELPAIASHFESDSKDVMEFPFNMRFAKINNWRDNN